MRSALKRLLIVVASAVLESLSVPKEQVIRHQQQRKALRRVQQCERALAMVQSNDQSAVAVAQEQLQTERLLFSQLYDPSVK